MIIWARLDIGEWVEYKWVKVGFGFMVSRAWVVNCWIGFRNIVVGFG